MSSDSYIFLGGASRGVGREVAVRLVQRSFRVKALLRSESAKPELEAMGITVAMGDALDIDAVHRAMCGSSIDTVISTIGGLPKDGQRADYLGNKNLIDAAVESGARAFILVSSIGSGMSAKALPPQALETLGSVLAEKEKAEQHLINSGLAYTIIRPGGLKSEPATGNGVLTENPAVAGTIHRADVAELACQCLQSERTRNKILSAVDRQMVRGERTFEVFHLDS
ncbi:MAG: SDR family oxidoreductase [Elainellaceae cyanobacterium]